MSEKTREIIKVSTIAVIILGAIAGLIYIGFSWGERKQIKKDQPIQDALEYKVDSLNKIISNVEISYKDLEAECSSLDRQLKASEKKLSYISSKYQEKIAEISKYTVSECQEQLDARFTKDTSDTAIVVLTDGQARQDLVALEEGDCAKEQRDSLEVCLNLAKNSIDIRDSLLVNRVQAYNMQAQVLRDANAKIAEDELYQEKLKSQVKLNRGLAIGFGCTTVAVIVGAVVTAILGSK